MRLLTVPFLALLVWSGCGYDICATGGEPSLFCQGSSVGNFGCDVGAGNLFECNLDQRFVQAKTVPIVWPFELPFTITTTAGTPGVCGVVFCATSQAAALAQAAAISGIAPADPSLACVSMGTSALDAANFKSPAWPSCAASTCDPCSDGNGGTLQAIGEHCGTTSQCCMGLTCVGAAASTMGTCQGSGPQCPPATSGACAHLTDPCREPGGTGNLPCCDTNLSCQPDVSTTTDWRCCSTTHGVCDDDDDCCLNTSPSGSFVTCNLVGGSGECCVAPGNYCSPGTCCKGYTCKTSVVAGQATRRCL